MLELTECATNVGMISVNLTSILGKTGPIDEELKQEQVQGNVTGHIHEITNLFYEYTLKTLCLFNIKKNRKSEKGYGSLL